MGSDRSEGSGNEESSQEEANQGDDDKGTLSLFPYEPFFRSVKFLLKKLQAQGLSCVFFFEFLSLKQSFRQNSIFLVSEICSVGWRGFVH